MRDELSVFLLRLQRSSSSSANVSLLACMLLKGVKSLNSLKISALFELKSLSAMRSFLRLHPRNLYSTDIELSDDM